MGFDPVGVDEDNPHSFNRYAYGNNNPYEYLDPDGREPVHLATFATGALIDAAARVGRTPEGVPTRAIAEAEWTAR